MSFYVKDVEGRMHIVKRRTAHDQAPSAKQQVREILGSLPRQMLQEVHDMCRDHLGRSAGDHAPDDRTDESGLYRLDENGNCTGEIAGKDVHGVERARWSRDENEKTLAEREPMQTYDRLRRHGLTHDEVKEFYEALLGPVGSMPINAMFDNYFGGRVADRPFRSSINGIDPDPSFMRNGREVTGDEALKEAKRNARRLNAYGLRDNLLSFSAGPRRIPPTIAADTASATDQASFLERFPDAARISSF
jgi:hypothetical protein